jgi:RimJ/RimL family protein N-acetyltransferase
MNIKTGNIILRDLDKSDLPKLKEIRDLCLDYLDTPISFSLEETISWFENTKPKWYTIEIHDKVAGYIRTSDYDENNKSLYVGLDLHEMFRGYGYAFQSYQLFLNWAKLKGYLTAYLKVQISNIRAYNLYRKLGFLPIGIIPDAIIKGDTTVDSVIMYKKL